MRKMLPMKKRCSWANPANQLYVDYHDKEWGRPVFDDLRLFEMLCLEGAQAGLSWETVLKKREHYRKVFDGFNPYKISKYKPSKIEKLLQDPGIIRNRLKVNAFIENAKVYVEMDKAGESFSTYLWSFVGTKPITNKFKTSKMLPAQTELSNEMSKALKKRGFRFVGPTICYAFMQAVGMVNDHSQECYLFGKKIK